MDNDGKPVQLIRFERRDDYEESLKVALDSNVLDNVLKTCKDKKTCVITATGHAQSGKGLLLNVIKEGLMIMEKGIQLETDWLPNKKIAGFQCNHGYKPSTKGIWIWNRAFLIKGDDDEEIAVLLLETQGYHDEFTKPDEMAAILGISLLTSSLLVLNFSGQLPSVAFDWLATFCDFGVKLLEKGIEQPFQNLSFLIRDWTRLSEYSYGPSSGRKLLQKMTKASGDVGRNLVKCFEEVNCFLMPHIGGQALLETFEGQRANMSNDFSKRLQTYVRTLCNPENLRPMKILDNSLTAGEWKQFLTAYVALFNDKSETEWGLQVDSIWRLTKETAGKLKISQALTAYRQGFLQQMQDCVGGYIRERSMGGVHVLAKGKAKEAFLEFTMPDEDEKYFLGKLEQVLEEENEKVKQENKHIRSSMITGLVNNALSKMRSSLETLLPFTSEDETNVPAEFIFYEDARFNQALKQTLNIVEQEFLDNFPDEDVEEISKVKETLRSVLQPIVQKYTETNVANKKRTTDMAAEATERLKKEYKLQLNDFLENLPESEAKALRYQHKLAIKSLEVNFNQLKIGSTSFQQQLHDNLLEELEDEYDVMESNLDWTYKKALEMAQKEQEKYWQDLKERSVMLESEDVEILQDFHKSACKSILAKFATESPLRKNASKGEKILAQLESQLEMAYIEIVEEGVIAKRKLEKTLKQARDRALELYKGDMQNKIAEEGGFIYEDESFREISSTFAQTATEWFEGNAEDILEGNDELFDEEMGKMEKDLEAAAESGFKENKRLRIIAETAAALLCNQRNEEFEAKMTAAAGKLKTKEDLVKAYDQLHQQILEQFENGCTSTNEELRQKYVQILKKNAKETFSGLEEFFEIKMQTEAVGTMAALVEVKRFYFEQMDAHFTNKSGSKYFSAEELQRLHEHVKNMALAKALSMENSLSTSQLEQISERVEKYYETYKDKNDLIWRSYEEKEPTLGIDLGTTYCCAAVFHLGRVLILRNSIGENTTPSYITMDTEDGSTTFGEPAKKTFFESQKETIYNVKRIIGRRMDDKKLKEDMQNWPFTVVGENGVPKIKVAANTHYPEEISALLLKHLKEEAEETLGIPVNKAVITVPAYFTDGQRQATERAGQIAGFNVLGLLNEPTAAALAYKMEWFYSEEPRNILVFDLGGGTFDVVALKMMENKVDVLSIGGDDHLGGEDFDKNMMEDCARKFKETTKIDLFDGIDSPEKLVRDEVRGRLRRLQTNCEEAKKQLTNARSKATISIPSFVGSQNLIVTVKMEEFEKMNAKLFQKTLGIVDGTLNSAKLKKEDVDEIVLVGGSTRIPKVQQMLVQHFNGKALNKKINPDEAVAYGAAVHGAMLNAKPGSKVFDFAKVQEVTPMSLGIETATKELDVIIPKNSKIPIESTCTYQTYRDNQRTAQIKVYQGEFLELAAANKLLGEFTLDGIPPARATKEAVNVTMKINANGILSVEAVCQSTGGKKSITVSENRGGMSEEELQLLIQRVASN